MYKGENPVKKVKLPILQNRRERFLSHDEAAKLLSVLQERSRSFMTSACFHFTAGCVQVRSSISGAGH